MSIETLLHEEIQAEFEELKAMEVGSEKHKYTVDSVAKLYDRAIEMRKFDVETQAKEKEREIELNLKQEQMKEERNDRRWKNALTAAGIAIPTAVTIWGTIKSMEFEKEGTITTIMGRGFIQKLLPKK